MIIADTKFEFGKLPDGKLILIDEILTPDSSRFWPANRYAPGRDQESFDKQFVRNWLERQTWNSARRRRLCRKRSSREHEKGISKRMRC